MQQYARFQYDDDDKVFIVDWLFTIDGEFEIVVGVVMEVISSAFKKAHALKMEPQDVAVYVQISTNIAVHNLIKSGDLSIAKNSEDRGYYFATQENFGCIIGNSHCIRTSDGVCKILSSTLVTLNADECVAH